MKGATVIEVKLDIFGKENVKNSVNTAAENLWFSIERSRYNKEIIKYISSIKNSNQTPLEFLQSEDCTFTHRKHITKLLTTHRNFLMV